MVEALSRLTIGAHRGHLWVAGPERARSSRRLGEYESWLTQEERRKAASFVFARHRHEYLVTRALERTALTRYVGRSPASLEFARDELGRPRLSPDAGVRYSLSNTLELVVCLVSDEHEVGVDTEPLSRAPQILEVAGSVFASEERSALAGLSEPERDRRAVELWTLKESYIKALGKGLELPLDRFWFDVGRDRITLTLKPEIADQASRWAFELVEVDQQLVAVCIGCGRSTRPVIERFDANL
jgi:4'-phosphopantetheinyl transferase